MSLIILIAVIILVLIGLGVIPDAQVEAGTALLITVPVIIVGAFLGLISIIIGLFLSFWFITIPVTLMILL